MKASDLFIKALENEGVEYIFGVPGEENLDFLQSLKNSKIKLILTRHEQGAGFMAATYGRLTGKAGVCLSTLGPGATNLVTPAAYAQLGAMPMMMITGQKPIKKSKQASFQIIDVVDLMRPITKFTKQIVNSNNIASSVREAFRLAIEERPGAVHLELPEDIAQEDCEPDVFEVVGHIIPKADDIAIDQAVKMIQDAKMPLLLIGAGANRKITCEALREFVDTTGIYFFTTQMGKGVIDERHAQYLGTAALSSNDFIHTAIDQADLIINVGHDVIEKPPFFMKKGGKKVIHVNFSPAGVDPVYFPQLNVVGDITPTVKKLSQRIAKQQNWDFSFFEKVKKEVAQHLSTYFKDERFPMLPQRLVNLLRESLAPQDIITLDNGVYKLWFARNYTCYQPNTLLLDNALASMGAGLPSAMAVNMIHPDKKVVAVCGDGGFMMNSQELETAIRLKLNLTVIILNDNAFGMIKWKQEDMGFDDFGLDYKNPDFVKYAESYGANGYRPANDGDFQEILRHCLETDGVHVIDLPVDYSLNHPILNVMLKQKTQKL
ncbi:acetolactate synthase [Rhodonellum psychrophilum GCM71 = DSM 17998]|uniref:Acetolactate synthase n=2 Tax=Rhodonellum TaxID=336827 RepID=U5BYT2_9BACT|nr:MULTISPECIES: acetolactate synthase large subunit [Rhodonellum]ERM81801.1 acetolactate synthase [Rhodonellum psychrophilum GCM71 = DSM 17998]MDO9551201.1 acetolactate synthase large subunit [Rhodonellum sp.]SDZ28093.1 acetolactate synthase-1/2/3 large subunit [Rhodonellum ikkaensis]